MISGSELQFRVGVRKARRSIAILLLLGSAAAHATPVDDRTRAAARQLAQDGAAAFDAGQLGRAHALLHRAYALFPAPTIALMDARALAGLGRLVEAAERYELARRTAIDADAPEAFRDAVRDANRELAKLRPRIPLLTIRVPAHDPSTMEVRLDGRAVPAPLIGVHQPVDPGKHEVTLLRDQTTLSKRIVVLDQGEERAIVLTANGAPEDPGSAQRTWGYVALGVGGAGLITGVATGVVMLDKKSSLDSACDASCPPTAQNDLDSFRTARTTSFIGYGVGLAGIGAGALLLLTAPSEEDARLVPLLGPGQVGLRGTF